VKQAGKIGDGFELYTKSLFRSLVCFGLQVIGPFSF
jgi:hypothetical protein